ncbi:hepatitis A virus cellular receptor 1 homolog [Brachyhypopomus gauderio]|uniref:hepatitis A virus cellular receptor 1 homolog n=1 Tax=Brachyhypopomus gauderio TaxID=698409 RepID=UPI0040417719
MALKARRSLSHADGDKVTRKTSERYQLPGDIQNGDVSLTILIAKQSDSGIYGCRVHVPGWFNDEKNVVRLEIMQESVSTAPVNITDTATTRPWSQSETARGNSVNESITSLPESSKNVFDTMDDKLPGIVVSVLLVLLTVVIVAIYLMWKHKRRSRLLL